jgi:hypothetical protein
MLSKNQNSNQPAEFVWFAIQQNNSKKIVRVHASLVRRFVTANLYSIICFAPSLGNLLQKLSAVL